MFTFCPGVCALSMIDAVRQVASRNTFRKVSSLRSLGRNRGAPEREVGQCADAVHRRGVRAIEPSGLVPRRTLAGRAGIIRGSCYLEELFLMMRLVRCWIDTCLWATLEGSTSSHARGIYKPICRSKNKATSKAWWPMPVALMALNTVFDP